MHDAKEKQGRTPGGAFKFVTEEEEGDGQEGGGDEGLEEAIEGNTGQCIRDKKEKEIVEREQALAGRGQFVPEGVPVSGMEKAVEGQGAEGVVFAIAEGDGVIREETAGDDDPGGGEDEEEQEAAGMPGQDAVEGKGGRHFDRL